VSNWLSILNSRIDFLGRFFEDKLFWELPSCIKRAQEEEEEEEEDRLTVILDSPPEIMSVLSKKLLTVNVMG
jgi:hypothetical protein